MLVTGLSWIIVGHTEPSSRSILIYNINWAVILTAVGGVFLLIYTNVVYLQVLYSDFGLLTSTEQKGAISGVTAFGGVLFVIMLGLLIIYNRAPRQKVRDQDEQDANCEGHGEARVGQGDEEIQLRSASSLGVNSHKYDLSPKEIFEGIEQKVRFATRFAAGYLIAAVVVTALAALLAGMCSGPLLAVMFAVSLCMGATGPTVIVVACASPGMNLYPELRPGPDSDAADSLTENAIPDAAI
ncbi:hypothetical protein A5677_18250 [Mycobacterium malmoense]|uniref:Uncharacterized protein n=1 Tax=Mycobacterium malmoense TaxID=1780 RepID=A0A1B9D9H4_MYCMA|nr:hypothetical protein A5677_18250 [Mycobacterium malmoense]